MQKKILLLILVGLSSCLSEDSAEVVNASTFVRYFNGGFNDVSVGIEETVDKGLLILANSFGTTAETPDTKSRIKIIKTDASGNFLWQKLFPDSFESDAPSYIARSLIKRENGGYVVIGDEINNGVSNVLVLVIDESGAEVKKTVLGAGKGHSIVENRDMAGNITNKYLALIEIVGDDAPTKNMALGEIDTATLAVGWTQTYGAGTMEFTNSLILNGLSQVIWGGSVTRENSKDVRLVKTNQNSPNVLFDLPIGSPAANEFARSICRYGNGFAVVGTTDENGNDDIFFKRLSETGTEQSGKIFLNSSNAFDESGNAITTAIDGGLLILGTYDSNNPFDADTSGDLGRGQRDYYLIKIDAFGNEEWRQIFGSRDDDEGVAVKQLTDGGILILGTTRLAQLGTVMLVKTDALGDIQ
jgi:hypothetical protein